MLAIGACETAIIATSWFSRWTTKPLKPSAIAEHAGQPAVYSGPNMKWYIRSCERPLNRSANEALPSSVSKRKSFSRGTQGSSCRFRASSSLRRVSSFSASSSSSRAASHSSRVPVLWFVISLLSSRYIGVVRPWIEDGAMAATIPRATIADARGTSMTAVGGGGYDLTGLFVGSEGTLGVITQATLRLRPASEPPATLVAFFPDLTSAGVAVAQIASRVVPMILELMDRATVRAVEEWKQLGLDVDAAALLLARSDAGGDQAARDTERMARMCESAGATFVARSSDPIESDLLMTARRLAFHARERQGSTMPDDVAVPIGRIPELLQAIQETAARHGLLIGTFGHAGDGNMHPTIVFDANDAEEAGRARFAFEEILQTTLGLGGTITGEHGVGLLKRPYLGAEIGEDGLRLQLAIKRVLDPLDILNPGKVL